MFLTIPKRRDSIHQPVYPKKQSNMSTPSDSCTVIARRVRFAENAVSAIYRVDQRTDAENRTLFYQAVDEQRSRSEVQLEKLEASLDASSSDDLNKVMDLFRNQFKVPPSPVALPLSGSCTPITKRRTFSRSSGSTGSARIA